MKASVDSFNSVSEDAAWQKSCFQRSTPGGLLTSKSYVDVPAEPRVKNLTFSIPIFCPITLPSVYLFDRKIPNFAQIGCFLQCFAQNTPNFFFSLGSFVSDENPPITIPNFVKKHPKRQAHIPSQVNVRTTRAFDNSNINYLSHIHDVFINVKIKRNVKRCITFQD